MLDSLTILLEKIFLLANLNVFSWIPVDREQHCEVGKHFHRGDLLQVPRTLFTHFGIYLGDGKVAHMIPDIMPVLTRNTSQIRKVVTNKRLLLGVLCKYATIRVDTLDDFAYGSPISFNSMDTVLRKQPLPSEDVARTAESLVGIIPYSLLWNNCEHFVTYCRYGSGVSLQTDKFCEWLKSLIRDQRCVFLSAFLGILCIIFKGMDPSTTLPTLFIPFILWMAG